MKKLFLMFLVLFPVISMAIIDAPKPSNGFVLSSSGNVQPGTGPGGSVGLV